MPDLKPLIERTAEARRALDDANAVRKAALVAYAGAQDRYDEASHELHRAVGQAVDELAGIEPGVGVPLVVAGEFAPLLRAMDSIGGGS